MNDNQTPQSSATVEPNEGNTRKRRHRGNRPRNLATNRAMVRYIGNLTNQIMSRTRMIEKFLDPRRDLDDECGYPDESPEGYWELFETEGTAARVVELFPQECFETEPDVYEDESAEIVTPFEQAWDSLPDQLRGLGNFYQDQEGSPIWEVLERADIISGIGRYGIILIGLNDGQPLNVPAQPRPGQKLTYLKVFPESQAKITHLETDTSSPRFGQPTEYGITFQDPEDFGDISGVNTSDVKVHWSRIIHIADNITSSEVLGTPRMRPVRKRLLDLRKLYGGSAEMYWRGAFFGLSLESHPELGGEVNWNEDELKQMMQNYMEGLQRYLITAGASVKALAPSVVDPTNHINVQIEGICIKLSMPVRIFKGSERGELASSEDRDEWNNRKRRRRRKYIIPRILVPFINRLIMLMVLPQPRGYSIFWPDSEMMSEQTKATIAGLKAAAIAAYMTSGAEAIMAPMDFFTRVMGMDEEEAAAVVEAVSSGIPGVSGSGVTVQIPPSKTPQSPAKTTPKTTPSPNPFAGQ